MPKKIKLQDKEYDIDELSESAKAKVEILKFTNGKLKELNNLHAVLQRAKLSYLDSIKKELYANKAGFFLDD